MYFCTRININNLIWPLFQRISSYTWLPFRVKDIVCKFIDKNTKSKRTSGKSSSNIFKILKEIIKLLNLFKI